jgi:hypothetical protein
VPASAGTYVEQVFCAATVLVSPPDDTLSEAVR